MVSTGPRYSSGQEDGRGVTGGRNGVESPHPLVSVIVPFRNSEKHVAALLESLVSQATGIPWEIILVDNQSTDDSRRIAERYATQLPLRVVEARERAGAAYARNVGVRHSLGRRLLFVDADDTLADGYVSAMTDALDAEALVTSRVDSLLLNPAWVREAHGPPWQVDRLLVFYDFLPATGINIGIDRARFDRLGGFAPEFSASEDIAFSWDAQLKEGIQIKLVDSAVYRYRYRDSLRALLIQGVAWGRSSALLYRRYRSAGMPGRPVKVALREWGVIFAALAKASRRSDLAPLAVRLGAALGRLVGCVRYGVLFP